MEKLKISQAIVVEGKYDKIKLSSVVDGVIICTNGFGIFKDEAVVRLIRRYARTSGIVILTDSDSAGFKIRARIKGICPKGSVTNLYIPDVFGKEKRKEAPSKEGKLGVEGIDVRTLHEIFLKAGICSEASEPEEPVTKLDLYELGLSGREDSSRLRRLVISRLDLPEMLTAGGLLEAVNSMFGREEFFRFMEDIRAGAD